MGDKYMIALDKVKKYGQEQLLSCYDKLSEEQKGKLLEDILDIDFEQVKELYDDVNNHIVSSDVKIEPISFVDKQKLSDEELEYYRQIGEKLIRNGEYAVVTMAGGQGTRLGHTRTKRNIYARYAN